MKLYYSSTSPYARKVRLAIIEKGLGDLVEEILVDPFQDNLDLRAVNPLRRVPALRLDDGKSLFDSPVICHYLDDLSERCPLVPKTGWGRWSTLRWEALADGLMDAAYNLVMERRRPTPEQSSSWIGHWSAEIRDALDELECHISELDGDPTLAHLAVGAAIGYLDFRLPELLYEAQCPQVAAFPRLQSWYQAFATRLSMTATHPGNRQ